jgi:hypothetical protein
MWTERLTNFVTSYAEHQATNATLPFDICIKEQCSEWKLAALRYHQY